MITIYQKALKLIKNIVLLIIVLPLVAWGNPTYELANPQKSKVFLRLALTKEEHMRGLSGVKSEEFKSNEGMLFVNEAMGMRQFWMPDTYFNLDIIFLDSELNVVGIEKNVPFHKGMKEPPPIYRTKAYKAQFVLETKAESEFSKDLKIGDKLSFISSLSLSEIVLKTHRSQ